MKNCVWLKPKLVAQIEFTEWTPDGHLRHSKFVGLREDKAASEVVREIRPSKIA
jgi:bifunctional non-homologous end joining protein LigD